MEKVKLKVEGIECMGCVKRIENVLSQIKDVIANLENIDFQAKIEE